MDAWLAAENAKKNYENFIGNTNIEDLIVELMLASGFFSVWMTVFNDYSRMKNLFIDSISGTRESGCFDDNGDAVYAHCNLDKLQVSRFKSSLDNI